MAEGSIVLRYDAVSLGMWFLTFKRKTVPLIDDGEGTYFFETLRSHHQCHSIIPKKYGILKNFFIASVLKTENNLL